MKKQKGARGSLEIFQGFLLWRRRRSRTSTEIRNRLAEQQKGLLRNDRSCTSPWMKALHQLDQQGWMTDNATYASLVRWCGDTKCLSDARQVHAHIVANQRDGNTFLANLLVQMYGKCGSLEDARIVFNKMGHRNVFSWNFMISVYAQNGREADALQVYRQMQMEGVKPDKFTFFPILSAAANLRDLAEGKQIHERIVAGGFNLDMAVRTALVNMYGKCDNLKDAWAVFDELHNRDVFLWNAMIAAYAQNGHAREALDLFRQMDLEGIKPDKITFLSILEAPVHLGLLDIGRSLHEHIIACGFDSDVAVKNALVNMYGRCRSLNYARAVFDSMHKPDVISWTTMITAYMQNGQGREALWLFRQMDSNNMKPNRVTFLSILDGCANLGFLKDGREIHKHIVESGFQVDVAVRTALVHMYGKCGSLKDARMIFYEMPERDVILWTAMISAYSQNGYGKEALELFRQMDREGFKPNRITFLAALDACASLPSLEDGRMIHKCIAASGYDSDLTVKNAILNMYGKCGSLKDARTVFNKMPERNVISWTSLIAAYVQNGHDKEGFKVFSQMDLEGISPNAFTFVSILDACASLASLENGKSIHQRIVASGYDSDVIVRNALVNMYSKCGSLKDARAIFDETDERDLVSWNSMLAGYAQNGHGKEALELFSQMELESVKPDGVTFLNIFGACNHAGFLDRGWQYFVCMSGDYGIMPMEMHYACISDLLGRAGFLDEVESLIINMPVQPTTVTWVSLLGACRIHGDMERGLHAAEHVLELDPENMSTYILLSNIYAAGGRWNDVTNVRTTLEERGS